MQETDHSHTLLVGPAIGIIFLKGNLAGVKKCEKPIAAIYRNFILRTESWMYTKICSDYNSKNLNELHVP